MELSRLVEARRVQLRQAWPFPDLSERSAGWKARLPILQLFEQLQISFPVLRWKPKTISEPAAHQKNETSPLLVPGSALLCLEAGLLVDPHFLRRSSLSLLCFSCWPVSLLSHYAEVWASCPWAFSFSSILLNFCASFTSKISYCLRVRCKRMRWGWLFSCDHIAYSRFP